MMAFGWCAAFGNTTRRKLLSSLALASRWWRMRSAVLAAEPTS